MLGGKSRRRERERERMRERGGRMRREGERLREKERVRERVRGRKSEREGREREWEKEIEWERKRQNERKREIGKGRGRKEEENGRNRYKNHLLSTPLHPFACHINVYKWADKWLTSNAKIQGQENPFKVIAPCVTSQLLQNLYFINLKFWKLKNLCMIEINLLEGILFTRYYNLVNNLIMKSLTFSIGIIHDLYNVTNVNNSYASISLLYVIIQWFPWNSQLIHIYL